MIVVIARIRAKSGQGDELEVHLRRIVEWVTENEAGTLTYVCSRSTKDADTFTFFERYADQSAFDAHVASREFAAFGKQIGGLLAAAPEIETYTEVAAKL
jgi:quinol monooxygenase YgiN